ncbi:MAG: hypothetical protein J1F40_00035 [Prevotellaceae bacterium]|nr:hypothetical protein [Prevotellaceae bacterium]
MKKFIFALMVFGCTALLAVAQNNGGQRRQRIDQAEMNNRMAERLASQMKLDKEKTELFKLLFLDYQTARQNAANPKGEDESANERVNLDKIDDAKATELIDKQFAVQEAQLAVDREYLPKFLEILTPAQTARIYLRRGNQQRGQQMQGGQGGPRGFGGGPGGGGFGGGGFGGDF